MRQGGTYRVYADASDVSAVGSVSADLSNVTTGQTAVPLPACVAGCTVGGHTYGFRSALLTASAPLAQGSRSYTVGAVDVVGNTSSPSSFAVQVDNTGPSVTTVIAATTGTSPQGFVKQGGTYRVYANASDLPAAPGTFSGLDAATLAANVSTVSAGLSAVALTPCGGCGPGSGYAFQTAQLTADAVLAEGNKLYSVTAADNLGTSASSSGANVQVDNTGPSVTTVIAATTGTSPQGFVKQGGTYRVYANASDLPAAPGTFSGLDAATLAANVSTVSTGQSAVAAHALWRLRPGLGVRLPDGTADGRRGARRREQAVLGLRRRQPGHERELLGRERAGGQHGPVGYDGDRGDYRDESAGLREAGRDLSRVCERERSARGSGHLLGSRRGDACGQRLHRERGPERGRCSRPVAAAARARATPSRRHS